MTGPDRTIFWKEQDIFHQSEFLLEQQCFSNCDSYIPGSEQENSFSAVPVFMSEYMLQVNIVQNYCKQV